MTILPPTGSKTISLILLTIITVIIVLFLVPILPIGGPFGYWDAKRDVAQGRLQLKMSVRDFGWEAEWKKLVKERYGIQIGGSDHGCFLVPFPFTYDRAYNATQREAIIQKFGRDVVQETMLEAKRTTPPPP